ncbi:hypothetical protein EB001_15030 [bacterium]|nr:hypothetical protein [bacterium]
MEDSGLWSAFKGGRRNLLDKPSIPNHHIGQTLIPYMPDIVKPLYKGLALYIQNHGLSSVFVIDFG